jgi:S-DNA-T family DNA segregation ATPase FtsK/SpoIIIE
MAKKKLSDKSRGRENPGKGFGLGGLMRFIFLSPARYLILVAIVTGVLVWQWPAISTWTSDTLEGIVRLFGLGLAFIALAIGSLAWVISRGKLSSLFFHWNQWLGAIVLILAVWGMLGFFPVGKGILGIHSLGGEFGRGVIGRTDLVVGGLRLLGLLVVGVVLVAPGASFRLVNNSVSRLIVQFKRPGYRMIPHQEEFPLEELAASLQETAETPMAAAEPSVSSKPPPETAPVRKRTAPVPAASSTPRELKQVAQEVWKKYGESPGLVTLDGWKLPPIEILDITAEVQFSQADNAERGRLIEEALGSYGVEASVVQINAGPTVTQFGVEPGWDRKTKDTREKDKDGNITVRTEEISKTRVKVDRISSLSNDLALALASPSIRIEAPVPGKSVVGIEVPNTTSSMVSLRGVIETNSFQKIQSKARLAVALGKGAGGEAISADLAKMPHLLIAGSTGSGKSVCLNAIICCLMVNNTPTDLRFIMIDPKRVELITYNSVPHLAVPVIVDTEKAVLALHGLSREMNSRYQTMASAGARNIEAYNKNRQGDDKMPYLVLIIDELADLMMLGGDDVEQMLCRLAQLSRAVGIHLVVATQRPSVDVVTGLIKANFPTRISFAVSSQVDSRTILDSGGAEKLLGSGDMLYMPTEAGKPKRLQGCYVSDAEAERLVYFWGSQQRDEDSPLVKIEDLIPPPGVAGKGGRPEDTLMEAARKLAEEHEHISTSFLQRRLRIGYPRAARLMEQLENEMAEEVEDGEEAVDEEDEETTGMT